MLGNASFSIYLVHNPFLSLSQRLFAHFEFAYLPALLAGSLMASLAGLIYYFTYERVIVRKARLLMPRLVK